MIVDVKDIQEGYVKSETHKHVRTIEFFHPQSNSLPAKLLADLAHEITYAGNDKDVRLIILTSAGQNFCAGASFDELLQVSNEKEGTQFFSGFAYVINAMRKCPKFIIARVHGRCVGGGVGVVAAADYAIAVEGADIRLSELSLGIVPFVVGPAIERKIGLSCYSQLAIDSSMWRNGDWARRKGLYAELHPSVESMEESIARLSDTLANYSEQATVELKRLLWHDTENWDSLLLERAGLTAKLALTPKAREVIAAFKNKIKVGATS